MSSNINRLLLKNIAQVQVGFTFRESVKSVDAHQGNAHVAQIKDIRELSQSSGSNFLQRSKLPVIDWQGKTSTFVVPNAVLLSSKSFGGGFPAAYFMPEENALPLVVSNQFFLLTPKDGVLPEYLCWFLNRPQSQSYFDRTSAGTSLVMLTKSSVEEALIVLPSLEVQTKIVQLHQLWEKEQLISQKLILNRKMMLQGIFEQLLKEQD